MCGICGKLNFNREQVVSPALVRAMADTIEHRGPDDAGYYLSGPVGFGFRRLSIIDLSLGHQPLSNEDGSVWIAFNGEIYNYEEIRKELLAKGHIFKTSSDTEVIVHLYEELGEGCVERLRGMFGFAIWDDRKQTLFIARDRVGIKPIYYYLTDRELVFGSEIKAILADPSVEREIDPAMIDRFFTYHYLAGDETMFRKIRKLPPGSCMTVRNGHAKIRQYWDLKVEPAHIGLREAEERLESLLAETVKLHMISDVPVGFLLSGGFDSTALLSFSSELTDKKLSSFTVGFDAPGVVDERPYAALAAKRFGTEHHELSISAGDFRDFLPRYVWHMEEPVCEPPAVALYYVSQLARKSVKVLLSGEGGDEAFAGYQTYRNRLWIERARNAFGPLKGLAAAAMGLVNQAVKSPSIGRIAPMIGQSQWPEYGGHTNPFSRPSAAAEALYADGQRAIVNREFSSEALRRYAANAPVGDSVNRMLYIDTKSWLADDLLIKADKMTMASSIELRVPFLDHKVLEFAASLPGSFKVRGFTTKFLAKRALAHRVPPEIVNRKKVGFPVPYESWLRTELHDWVCEVLLDPKSVQRGYFEKGAVERLIAEDKATKRFPKELFSLVALELWQRAFLEAPQPAIR